MKIYFFECNNQDKNTLVEMLKNHPFSGDVIYVEEKLTEENAAKFADAEIISVFINSPLSKNALEHLPKLKFISTRSTGFDHIDSQFAKEKNIKISNVPAYGSRTVAEFAFSLILGLTRKSFLAYRQVKDSYNYDISNFEGFNLQGKTLGIIGTGRIGQNMAQIAKGFDMNILSFDVFPDLELEVKLGFKYVSLEELLQKSDVISLHVPYNKSTHHLINKENIKQIKPGAILINTARGEVADTEALLEAVQSKILSGLGLDVIEGEKILIDEVHSLENAHQDKLKILFKDHLLINRPEVAYTPHIAFFSREAKAEILNITVKNIVGFVLGKPENLLN